MNYLLAKSDKQLGICLRMLYNEGLTQVNVNPNMNDQHKIEFYIMLDISEEKFKELKEKYKMLNA